MTIICRRSSYRSAHFRSSRYDIGHLISPRGEALALPTAEHVDPRPWAGAAHAVVEHIRLYAVPVNRLVKGQPESSLGNFETASTREQHVLRVVHPRVGDNAGVLVPGH